jgi:hypothetical protein
VRRRTSQKTTLFWHVSAEERSLASLAVREAPSVTDTEGTLRNLVREGFFARGGFLANGKVKCSDAVLDAFYSADDDACRVVRGSSSVGEGTGGAKPYPVWGRPGPPGVFSVDPMFGSAAYAIAITLRSIVLILLIFVPLFLWWCRPRGKQKGESAA